MKFVVRDFRIAQLPLDGLVVASKKIGVRNFRENDLERTERSKGGLLELC